MYENAIFVEDFRVPEDAGGGGPVGRVARVSPNRSFGDLRIVNYLARRSARPRRISLGFAHSAAAA